MKTVRLLLMAGLLLSASLAQASDAYKFKVDFTDGRTALLAGPPEVSANFTEEQLARAATSRQFLFTKGRGAHFYWLSVGCGTEHPDCEVRINSRGGCSRGACDVGFTNLGDGNVQVRCYRETCSISVNPASKEATAATLKGAESANFKFGSDFEFRFEGEAVAP